MKKIPIFLLLVNMLQATVTTLPSENNTITDSVNSNELKEYQIAIQAGKTLRSAITDLEDDADVYVRIGALPTATEYDCRSINSGTNDDDCSVTVNSDSDVFVTVYGFHATSYTLTLDIVGGDVPDTVTNINLNQVVTASVAKDKFNYYKVSADTSVNAVLNHLSADADVYIKVGEKPTRDSYDCHSTHGGTTEDACSVDVNENSDVYIGIFGYKAASYQLVAEGDAPDSVTDINLNQVVTASVAKDKFNYYKVSTDSAINAVLNHLSADADVYIKVGEKPTRDSYDCHSTHGGTTEDACSVDVNEASDVYIGVYGYRAANYQLVAEENATDSVTNINLDQVVTASVAKDKFNYYKVSTDSAINAVLNHLSADADVYVKVGEKPTRDSYDCHSTHGGTTEDACSVNVNENSDVYIGVFGYRAANYSLVANAVNGDGTTILNDNSPQNGSIAQGEMTYYKIAGSDQYTEITLDQLSADLDLYVKVGEKPTVDNFDAKSSKGSTKTEYSLLPVDAEHRDVYIGVYGYRAGNYRITAKYQTPLAGPTVYEDAEGGSLNPNWQRTGSQSEDPILVETPDIPNAPDGEGTLVLVPEVNGHLTNASYSLETNNYTQTILSVDCGGLPDYLLPFYHGNEHYRGYIVHYDLGVVVETLKGPRSMHWYSFFNHNGTPAFASANGYLLSYPSPVETTSGYHQPTDVWNHFEVDLNEELQKLEPDNKIYKVNYFYASGGFLDNIQLSTKE